ncbi:MAG: MEDS domain-containing protein [Candidatus Thorarchaeota archaeon]|jgi:sugar-specific transcriptional regulator TrmB
MAAFEDSAKKLSEFGLTPYEAKVYLAAAKLGPTSASKISKIAKIRREEVYRTLPKLEKAGLIDRVLGRPVKIRAMPIKEALTFLITRKEEQAKQEITELYSKKESILENFEAETEEVELEEESYHFTLISEKDAVAARTTALIDGSKNSIDIVDSCADIVRFILNYAETLQNTVKRDVKVRILTVCPDDEHTVPEVLLKHVPHNSFSLRYIETLPSRYVMLDRKQALITTTPEGTLSDLKCLWTDDSSLVGIIERDFEEQYAKSRDWKDFRLSPSERMTRIVKHLRPRDHVILVYDSLEAKRNTLFNYLRYGLDNGEAVKYVCSEESPNEIRDAMQNFGIPVSEYEKTGALDIMNYTDIYIRDGEFSVPEIMNAWDKYYSDALAAGFKGLRVTGEMSCFMKHSLVDELIEYEKALHTILDIPLTAICAYNSETLASVENPIDVYSELVKAHGKVLFASKDTTIGKVEMRKA